MSYQVIARKYRPQRFSDVVGQEHITQTLSNAITQGRIAHAYLFVGPRGTGKTTIARIFAKCLNCTGGPKVEFPEDDPIAKEITEGRSLDVLEIDGASNRGIDEIRELRETVKYAPANSKFKIYIIDEVHMLTKEAFNALLKTLEEPPAHVKFMFATTEPEKVLPTILSRCQRFDLRRIPSRLITSHLAHISKLEKVSIDAKALDAIARGAEGGMRDAESTLDQLISFCGDKIEEADVLSMFGLAGREQVLQLSKALLEGNAETALRELNDLANQGKDLGRLVADLLSHFRNLLIFQVSRGDLGMIEASEMEAASLAEQSKGVSGDSLTRIMDVLADCEWRLRDASSRKIMLEVALLKAIEARNAVSIDRVLEQLKQMRDGGEASPAPSADTAPAPARPKPAAPAAPSAVPQVAAPAQPPPPPVSAPADNSDLGQLWTRLLDAVGRASPFAKSYLLEAHPVSFANNLFIIGFDPEFEDHIGLVDNERNHTLLRTKLGELGAGHAQVKFIKSPRPGGVASASAAPTPEPAPKQAPAAQPKVAAAPAAAPAAAKPAPVAFDKNSFKNDPLIQKALEVFKGQIVEVRS